MDQNQRVFVREDVVGDEGKLAAEVGKHAELARHLEVELLGFDRVEPPCLVVMMAMHVDDHSPEGGVHMATQVVHGLVDADQIEQRVLVGGRGTDIHREERVVRKQHGGDSAHQ